jgi:hypothetical protein
MAARRVSTESGTFPVVDDTLHSYEETEINPETLFPLLRLGGVYLIEDSGWPHEPPAQSPDHMWAHKSALTNLIFELVMAAASEIGAFREIDCGIGFASIERGKLRLPTGGSFRLDDYIRTRGRSLVLI